MMIAFAFLCGLIGTALAVVPRAPFSRETAQIAAGVLLVAALASFGTVFAAASF